jgi:hypothetical protein
VKIRVEMGNQDEGGQRVVLENGELLEGVKSIRWSARAAERPILELEMFPEKVDFDLGATR